VASIASAQPPQQTYSRVKNRITMRFAFKKMGTDFSFDGLFRLSWVAVLISCTVEFPLIGS